MIRFYLLKMMKHALNSFSKIPSSFLFGRSCRNCPIGTLCDVRFIYSTVMTSSVISPVSFWGISSSSRQFVVSLSSRWCSEHILVSICSSSREIRLCLSFLIKIQQNNDDICLLLHSWRFLKGMNNWGSLFREH